MKLALTLIASILIAGGTTALMSNNPRFQPLFKMNLPVAAQKPPGKPLTPNPRFPIFGSSGEDSVRKGWDREQWVKHLVREFEGEPNHETPDQFSVDITTEKVVWSVVWAEDWREGWADACWIGMAKVRQPGVVILLRDNSPEVTEEERVAYLRLTAMGAMYQVWVRAVNTRGGKSSDLGWLGPKTPIPSKILPPKELDYRPDAFDRVGKKPKEK